MKVVTWNVGCYQFVEHSQKQDTFMDHYPIEIHGLCNTSRDVI